MKITVIKNKNIMGQLDIPKSKINPFIVYCLDNLTTVTLKRINKFNYFYEVIDGYEQEFYAFLAQSRRT